MKAFEECMKNAFKETGVAPQYNTPAWKVCEYAYRAGMLRAAEIAEDVEEGCGYECPNIIVDAIRKEAESDQTR